MLGGGTHEEETLCPLPQGPSDLGGELGHKAQDRQNATGAMEMDNGNARDGPGKASHTGEGESGAGLG